MERQDQATEQTQPTKGPALLPPLATFQRDKRDHTGQEMEGFNRVSGTMGSGVFTTSYTARGSIRDVYGDTEY